MKINLTDGFPFLRKTMLLSLMRLFLFLFCTTVFSFSSYDLMSQNATVRFDSDKELTVDQIFDEIIDQTDYTFLYQIGIFDGLPKIKVKKGKIKANKLLERSLPDGRFKFNVEDKNIIVVEELQNKGVQILNNVLQQISLQGIVVDENEVPLIGVNVIIKGTNNGTMTDIDGKYILQIPENQNDLVLTFSYVGYETQEVKVGSRKRVNVNLRPSESALDEVVVIGYGTSTVRDLAGVSSRISEKDIKNAPMGASIQSMLQGKASGVNVNIQSASPTSPVSVIIRGASSLSGDNQPLWVIDGVPQYAASTSGNVANTLYNLNLNDVQSIDILKDASATAVYGSRAANGVVIVTTKKGNALMKPTIEVSSRVGFNKQNFNDFKYMEADEYINFADAAAREAVMTRGGLDYFTRQYLDEPHFFNLNTSEFDKSNLRILEGAYFPGNTDWQKEMTTNPINIQHDISLKGGSEKTTYYASFNYRNDEGIVKGGNSELFGGRLNLDSQISDKLRFGINLNASSRETNIKDNMLGILNRIRPDIPPFNEDGTIFTKDPYTENPYTTLRNTNSGKGFSLSATGFFELDVVRNLQLRSSFTNNYVDSESIRYDRRGTQHNYTGSRYWNINKSSINVWENTLTYANMIGEKHDINTMIGYSMENTVFRGFGMNASNFPDDDILNNFGSAAQKGSLSESKSESALVSQFARIYYKYDDRYIVSGTIRRDGSSRFGANQRWGVFPSVSAGWIITGEDFMQKESIKNIFSYLKLRFSTGLTGSQNLGNYDWISVVRSSQWNESPAIIPSSIGNPDLQWEQTRMTDYGFDYGLFDDRVWGSFGLYKKDSKELIYGLPLPPSSSFNNITSNVASIENNGVEFDIKYDAIRTPDSRLTIDFNIAQNLNRVTKINGVTEELNFPNNNNNYMVLKPGELTGEWYGYQTAGRLLVTAEEAIALQGETATGGKLYYRNSQETAGDLYVVDQNGDGVITPDDKVNLGSSVPKAFGGFGFTFQHKGFMINTTFTYAYGHKRLWDLPMRDVRYVGNYNQNNLVAGQSSILLSPYDATVPRMGHYQLSDNGTFSDVYLHDASHIRLNALNVAYRIPERYLEGMLLRGVDITFQATNLFTITKYPGMDPQGNWSSSSIGAGMGIDNGTYPSSQTFNLGVKFTLK